MQRALLFLLSISPACNRAPKALPGDLEVTWRGVERGRFLAPLEATHCAESGQVELLAIRGDTGVGIALFLHDSAAVQPGEYPVVPGSQYDEPRPGATVAARWFATTTITGFEGMSGKVVLSATGPALTGSIDAILQGLDRPDTLVLEGRFSQVPLTKADSSCRLVRKRHKM